MKLVHNKSGKFHEATITFIEDKEWNTIDRSPEFEFEWEKEKNYQVYKIVVVGKKEILGLISIEDIPAEFRLHVRLIENSIQNRGKNKEYENVAGCLIAFICELSFEKGYDGFVSLKPKTELIELYKSKYRFKEQGIYLYVELENSKWLIKKYLRNG